MNLDATTVLKAVLGTARPEATRILIDAAGAVADLVVDGRRYQLTLRPADEVPNGKEPAPVPEAPAPAPRAPSAPPAPPVASGAPVLTAESEDASLVPPDATKPRPRTPEEHFRSYMAAIATSRRLIESDQATCRFLASHPFYAEGEVELLRRAGNALFDRNDRKPLLRELANMLKRRQKDPRRLRVVP